MLKYKDKIIADAGYVMNLPERTDRLEHVTNVLEKLEITGWQINTGYRFEDHEWKRYGCTRAYMNIFEDAIKNNYESIFVFEDDIRITDMINDEQINQIFESLPEESENYDFIAFGTRPLWESKVVSKSNTFGTVTNCLCTQCYFYKKDFILYAYETLKDFTDPNSPHYRVVIDEFISDCSSHDYICKKPNKLFRAGITIPMMFTQQPSYSDNEGDFMNYQGYIEDSYWNALNNGKQ